MLRYLNAHESHPNHVVFQTIATLRVSLSLPHFTSATYIHKITNIPYIRSYTTSLTNKTTCTKLNNECYTNWITFNIINYLIHNNELNILLQFHTFLFSLLIFLSIRANTFMLLLLFFYSICWKQKTYESRAFHFCFILSVRLAPRKNT